MRLVILTPFLAGLTGCAAVCPVPQEVRSPQCNKVIDGLQAQDAYLKGLVNSRAPIEKRFENARKVQENLRIQVMQVPGACQPGLAKPLVAEVNYRIGQIDAYLASGVWQGPVG